jgi:hypothetical protein
MMTLSADDRRALSRLAAPGARCLPDPHGRGYGVFRSADKRRRARATLSALAARRLVAEGLLCAEAEGGELILTAAGRAALNGAALDLRLAHRAETERAILLPEGRVERRAVDAAGSPLARLARLQDASGGAVFTAREIAAGERLHEDWLRAGFGRIATTDWTAPPRGAAGRGPGDPGGTSDAAIDARARVRRAMAAVGPGLDRALAHACLRLAPFDALERDEGWPRGAARTVVKLALARLAACYGA